MCSIGSLRQSDRRKRMCNAYRRLLAVAKQVMARGGSLVSNFPADSQNTLTRILSPYVLSYIHVCAEPTVEPVA